MKKILVMAFVLAMVLSVSSLARAEEKVIFGFEKDAQGFEIPEWALEQEDHVGKTVEVSKDFAKDGTQSLKLMAAFPGKVWAAAIVEDFEYFDWTPYKSISVDIYIPKEAPIRGISHKNKND